MARPSRFGWSSLTAIFLLFLSLLSIVTASPLPDDHVNRALEARASNSISQKRYEAYLKKYFPKSDRYLFYSGGAMDQLKAFKKKNPGYYYYDDVFNAYTDDHPWYKEFNADVDEDDGEASSKALAANAKGDVLVFGAIEYKTAGKASFFTREEIDILHDGLREGRIKSINHMAKDATSPSDVMAKEDADGNFTWQSGYKEGDKNAGSLGECKKRALGGCGAPKPNRKTSCGSKGKRADASNRACSMRPPSSTKSVASATASTQKSASASATATTKKAVPTTTKKAIPTTTKKAVPSSTKKAVPTSTKKVAPTTTKKAAPTTTKKAVKPITTKAAKPTTKKAAKPTKKKGAKST